jgi:hypothetical protein
MAAWDLWDRLERVVQNDSHLAGEMGWMEMPWDFLTIIRLYQVDLGFEAKNVEEKRNWGIAQNTTSFRCFGHVEFPLQGEPALSIRGFMSANDDFQALKTAVLKQGDALPAQRQYATLAWDFVLGFAQKKLGVGPVPMC